MKKIHEWKLFQVFVEMGAFTLDLIQTCMLLKKHSIFWKRFIHYADAMDFRVAPACTIIWGNAWEPVSKRYPKKNTTNKSLKLNHFYEEMSQRLSSPFKQKCKKLLKQWNLNGQPTYEIKFIILK